MGVIDFESSLSGRPGRAKDPEIEASKQRANERKQAQLEAQKSVNAKRKAEQERAKLQEQNRVNLTRIDRESRTSFLSELKKSKVPNREIGFFKPTAQLDVRKTKTPLNAFVPDAIPNNVFLDSSGAFNPIDTNVQKYVQTRNERLKENPPIQIQHNNPPPRIGRFPLSNYYSQLKGSGELGIRGPSRGTGPVNLGFKQPFVVRDIGNNWGVDRFTGQKLEGTGLQQATQILQVGFNALDELGGAVIGRQPSVYISRAGADLFRMGMFLASAKGLGFLEKQRVLKRSNPRENLGSVSGPITGVYPDALNSNKAFPKINRNDDLRPSYNGGSFGSESGNISKIGINLKKYDPLSLASQPGVRSLQLSINKKLDAQLFALTATSRDVLPPLHTLSIEKQKGSVPEEVLKAFPANWAQNGFNINSPDFQRKYNITIDSNLDFPSDKLLRAIEPVQDAITKVAGAGVRYLKNLRGPKVNISIGNPFKKLNIKLPKNPLEGKGGPNTFGLNPDIFNAARGFVDMVKGIKSPFDFNIDKVPIDSSKKSAVTQDLDAFADVGRDRVNLIPYGPRDTAKSPEGKTEEELDFIPFRFVDMNNNYIVFRAILSGISDTFTPDYAEEKYIGRPDKVYVYTGTTRTISFTFDVYPKSAEELPVLWEKMNALAGQTYPDMRTGFMVAPFTKLTIGEMFTEMPGYISALTYTVQDNGTWETLWTKSPKYIQANLTFIPIMSDLPASDQALYSYPWLQRKKDYDKDKTLLQNILKDPRNASKFAQEDLLGSLQSQGIDTEEAQKRSKQVLAMAGI